MQIKINLLPPELTAHVEKKRKQRLVIIGTCSVLLVFFVIYCSLFLFTIKTKEQTAHLQQERQQWENKVAAYAPYAELQTRAKEMDKLLEQCTGTSPNWVQLMYDIGRQIPPSVWLTDLQATYKEDDNGKVDESEITLRGAAYSHVFISDWLKRIKQMPGIEDVRYKFSSQDDGKAQEVHYEIKAQLAIIEPENDVAEKVGKQ